MNEITTQLLRRFYQEPRRMSRNRNFHAFLDSRVESTSRIGRFLRSLRHDLLNTDPGAISLRNGEVSNGARRFVLELVFHDGFRRSYLSDAELRILREDRRVDEVLRSIGDWSP